VPDGRLRPCSTKAARVRRGRPMTRRSGAQVGNDQFVDVLRQVSPSGIADWQARPPFPCTRRLAVPAAT
jgi:hypothetical protein